MKRNLDGRTFRRKKVGRIVMLTMRDALTLEDLRLDMQFLGMVLTMKTNTNTNANMNANANRNGTEKKRN